MPKSFSQKLWKKWVVGDIIILFGFTILHPCSGKCILLKSAAKLFSKFHIWTIYICPNLKILQKLVVQNVSSFFSVLFFRFIMRNILYRCNNVILIASYLTINYFYTSSFSFIIIICWTTTKQTCAKFI